VVQPYNWCREDPLRSDNNFGNGSDLNWHNSIGEIGLGPAIQLASVRRNVIIPDQLLRSYSFAVGLSIPGLAFPVLFAVGGWMCWVG